MKTAETAPIVNSATMIATMTENNVKLGHTLAEVVTLITAIRARLNFP